MKTIKIISFIAFLFISIVFFESCQKEQADTAVPEFTVVEPMVGDTAVGEVHIEFTATDNAGLDELVVTIKDKSETVIYSKHSNVLDLKVFAFHDHYHLDGITSIAPLTVTLMAMDKSGNTKTKEIPIFAKP